MHTQRFEGYYYNCQKYGHKAYERRSKSKWSSNKQAKVNHNGNSYNGIIIQDIVATIIKSMEMFLRIVLGNTLEVTIKGD